jgi:phosphoribosylamine--glycine ligase
MKVLVLGSDGRAHALVWKLFNSPQSDEVVCLPGNGGIAQIAPLVDLDTTDMAETTHWAFREGFDMLVPSDDRPLQQGLADEAASFNLGVCGPVQQSTRLGQSRCYAKQLLIQHGLPTAQGRAFTELAKAERYLAAQPLPVVLKADNRAVGEGVYHDRYTALTALKDLFASHPLEGSNDGVIIEEFLQGTRLSMSALTDGTTLLPMLPTWIYDRINENGDGPIAPAMGAHTSASTNAYKLAEYIHRHLFVPLLAALNKEHIPYQGILGIDCIVTKRGPRLTGLRCSMRDMEVQVVLPRLEDDLVPVLRAMKMGQLHTLQPFRWRDEASVGIALVAQGYPHHFPTGGPIEGLTDIDQGVLVFHDETYSPLGLRYDAPASRGADPLTMLMRGGGGASAGTAFSTTGGHVLAVVALAATLNGARGRAVINAERIMFAGCYFRGDVGKHEWI